MRTKWLLVFLLALGVGLHASVALAVDPGTSMGPTEQGPTEDEGTIAAGALGTSNAFACFGAHVVIWRVSSTTAKQCSLAVFEVSDDSTNWIASGTGLSVMEGGGQIFGRLVGVNYGGSPLVEAVGVIYGDGTGPAVTATGYIPWRWMRIKLRAGFTGSFGALANVKIVPIAIRDAGISDSYRDTYIRQ